MDTITRRQRHLVVSALLASATISLSLTDLPERQPKLSNYQDAWKTLNVPGKYYLYMRSYEDEPLYGLNSVCVSNELISVNEKENYTISTFGTTSAKDGSRTNRTVYSWARATEGYPAPNVIESSFTLEKDFVVEFVLAFSEYKNCDILRLPHRNNGCELWAKEGEMHKIEAHCFFIFHLLCGPEKYMVYDSQMCEAK
ncbi:male-specific histamine-binding salivary protein-like [Haemaphysalis longicornis]